MGRVGMGMLGIGLAAVVGGGHYAAADRSHNRIAHRYGSEILQGLPPGAVLMAEGDDAAFILDYLQRLEGMRPDVALYNRLGRGRDLLKGTEMDLDPAAQLRLRQQREVELIGQGDRPVFYLYNRRLPAEGYRLVPAGLCYRVWPADQPLPRQLLGSGPPMENAADPGWYRDPWVRKIQSNYAFMQGEYLLALGDSSAALGAYMEAARIAFDSRSTRFNVALMMMKNNHLKEAQAQGEAAVALDPWNPETRKLLAQIRLRRGSQP
jgi:tetratricopeptide (TPR) repeat protein